MKDERRRRFIAFFTRRYGEDRARFIADTGLTKGRVSQLFDPAQPFGEVAARRLAESLGLPGDYFERDAAPQTAPVAPHPQISPAPPGAVELHPARQIPIVGTTQAGPPDRIWEHLDQVESEQYVEVATRDPYAYGLRVEGDSMSPRIMEGDWVVVEPSTEPLPGDEVVVKLKNGDVMVKKFTARHGDTVILDSINPSFARIARHAGEIDYMHYVGPRLPPRSVRTRVKL